MNVLALCIQLMAEADGIRQQSTLSLLAECLKRRFIVMHQEDEFHHSLHVS
jgi:hypothetical protein